MTPKSEAPRGPDSKPARLCPSAGQGARSGRSERDIAKPCEAKEVIFTLRSQSEAKDEHSCGSLLRRSKASGCEGRKPQSFLAKKGKLTRDFIAAGRSKECPIIDVHGHQGAWQNIYMPNSSIEAMLASMDRAGVRLLIFSSHLSLFDPFRGNTLNSEFCARYPDRLRFYGAIQPNYSKLAREEAHRTPGLPGFAGFKFLSDYHSYPITGDNYKPALEYANEHRLPVLMHTWGGSPNDGPALWEEVAGKYPQATFIMGHAGSGEWQKAAQIARDMKNVFLDLCGPYSVRGVIEFFCEIAGSKKILFGTDLPWFDQHYGIGCIIFADISEEDRHNILHLNAERIFGL